MTEKETQKVLDGMQKVRPEMLDNEAKKLFEAIMEIADERDELKKELKQKNNQIEKYINILSTNDLLHIKEIQKKDKIIELMADIKKRLKEINENSRSIKWGFKIVNDYFSETEDIIIEMQNNQERKMIKDINSFKRELKREGLYSNKLDNFIEDYMKYYNE